MKMNPDLRKELEKNQNYITTEQTVKLGFSRMLLSQYVEKGLLERVGHGVYTTPHAIIDDMFLLQCRSDNIIFSHDTALFLNGLSDRTPFMHIITIPSNTSLSKSIREDCVCYYIKPELHKLGMIQEKTTFGNTVNCYNAERTVCDLLRSRNRCDEETVISGVKNYARYADKDLNRLFTYASILRVDKTLKKYLEVLL